MGVSHDLRDHVGVPVVAVVDDATTREAEAVARRMMTIERRLRLAGLKAERAEIFRAAREREMNGEVALRMVRDIDLLEARLRAAH